MTTQVQIYAQSNIFPRIQIYDSASPPGIVGKLVKLGFEVDINGSPVYSSPDQPVVAPWIQWLAIVGIGLGAFVVIRRAI